MTWNLQSDPGLNTKTDNIHVYATNNLTVLNVVDAKIDVNVNSTSSNNDCNDDQVNSGIYEGNSSDVQTDTSHNSANVNLDNNTYVQNFETVENISNCILDIDTNLDENDISVMDNSEDINTIDRNTVCDIGNGSNSDNVMRRDHSNIVNNNELSNMFENYGNGGELFKEVRNLRDSYPENVIVGHLNVNSFHLKFQEIADFIVNSRFDALVMSETKLDSSLQDSAIEIDGYVIYRQDKQSNSGGIIAYVSKAIPSTIGPVNFCQDDIEMYVTRTEYQELLNFVSRYV